MNIRLFVLSVILLWCSTLCYGAERRKSHDSVPSPSGTYAQSAMNSSPDTLYDLSPVEFLQYLESIPLPTNHQTTEAVVLMPRRDWITEEHIPEILKYMNSEKIVPIVAHGISSMLHFGVTTLGTHARCLLEGFIRDGYSGCTCTDQVKCKPADEYLQWWKAYTSDASIHAEIQEAESFVREAGKNFEEGGSGLDYDLIIPSPEDPSSEITILWQRTYYGISPKISSHLSSLYLHLFMLKKPGDAAAYAPYYIDKLKARFLKKGTIVQYGINGRLLFIVSGYDYIAIQDILLLFSESPPDQQKIDACIENLSNSDIRWDGTFSGLFPVVEGEVAKQLFSFGSYPTPALIAALDDPEKFVAAHVLLTLIHYKQFSTSASQWNGLTVELHANGDVVIDPGQIPTIKAMWEKEMFKASDSDESRSQQ